MALLQLIWVSNGHKLVTKILVVHVLEDTGNLQKNSWVMVEEVQPH
jgi:hypothetical protein